MEDEGQVEETKETRKEDTTIPKEIVPLK